MEINSFDKLVKKITQNILEKVDFKADFKTDSTVSEGSCLVLMPNISLGFKDYFEFIIKKYPKCDLYVGSKEEFSNTQYIENRRNIRFIKFDVDDNEFVSIIDSVKTIIVLGLKIDQLKTILETDDKDDINHIVLSSLMANKSVNIMINTNGVMLNKIGSIINGIRNMGIEITNIQQSNNKSLDKVDLITESYVRSIKESGLNVLTLNKKQLITPLAKDKLREYKIEVEYIEEDN